MRYLLLTLLGLLGSTGQAAEPITLFDYTNKPPYVINAEQERGLYYDLARLLNQRLPARHFVVRLLPRKRLDQLLKTGQLPGLVIGPTQQWFDDAQRYLWSEPFIEDANLLISLNHGPISRLHLDDVAGHRLGLLRGARYPELPRRVRYQREDAGSDLANLQRLRRGWLDAAVIGARTLNYYLAQQPAWRTELYAAEPALWRYPRRLLVPQRYAWLLPELNQQLAGLPDDPAWQALLNDHLQPATP